MWCDSTYTGLQVNLNNILDSVLEEDGHGPALRHVPMSAPPATLLPDCIAVSGAATMGVGQPLLDPAAPGRYTKSSHVVPPPTALAVTDLMAPSTNGMPELTWLPHGRIAFQPPPLAVAAAGPDARQLNSSTLASPMSHSATPSIVCTPSHPCGNMDSMMFQGLSLSTAPPVGTLPLAEMQRTQQLQCISEARKALMLKLEDIQQQEARILVAGANNSGAPSPSFTASGSLTSPFHHNMQQCPSTSDVTPCVRYLTSTILSPAKPQPPPPGLQSPMAGAAISIDSLRGEVYNNAKDQMGCRVLQRALDTNAADSEIVRVIMEEIVAHVSELMVDQYANFLVQKLFDIMPTDTRLVVARSLSGSISDIALTSHGTFSVQKLIETISSKEEADIIRDALMVGVSQLIRDVHGNHVIQKVLQRFSNQNKDFVYQAVVQDCARIAMDKQGCCVVQRCLEFASPSQSQLLIESILRCCLEIVEDPYGNYVLQFIISTCNTGLNNRLAESFQAELVRLGTNKFSSNVIEKLLKGCSQEMRDQYVRRLSEHSVLSCLLVDKYGNYVVQTALTVCSISVGLELVAAIRVHLDLIRTAPYIKKLEAKMDQVARRAGTATSSSPIGFEQLEERNDSLHLSISPNHHNNARGAGNTHRHSVSSRHSLGLSPQQRKNFQQQRRMSDLQELSFRRERAPSFLDQLQPKVVSTQAAHPQQQQSIPMPLPPLSVDQELFASLSPYHMPQDMNALW